MFEDIDRDRRRVLGGTLMTMIAPGMLIAGSASAQESLPLARLPVQGKLPSFEGATGWLNSQPLTPAGLRGKVVLIDIWTYTCINWLRTLPYVRAWDEKYRSHGLVVIGVHAPEFEFEKNVDNIRRAVTEMKINHPVAIDSNFAIWRALRNRAWPARYSADAQGRVRHQYDGEGEYPQAELVIQQLLAESGADGIDRKLVSIEGRGLEAPADWSNLRTPETYVGYGRAENFSSPGSALRDKRRTYAIPARLRLNQWALSGDWTVKEQFAALHAAKGRIAYRFHARDLHLVMGPAAPGKPVMFRVSIDGQPPRADRGDDVDEGGNGKVGDQRLYQLIRQRSSIQPRQFEIEFVDAGVEAFAFTFG